MHSETNHGCLTTERLVLRPFTQDDAPEVARLCNNERLNRRVLLLPYPYEETDARAWIGTHAERAAMGRAYTFAAPNCTTDPAARSERYDNIFNVLNPSDAVTMLLPAQWGYARHGRDVWLPTMTEDAELTQAMSASYEASMGVACPVKNDALALSEEFVGFLTDRVGGVDDLFSVGGAMAIAQACFGFDVGQVLTSHYPNTYIAWLDVTTAEDLRIE